MEVYEGKVCRYTKETSDNYGQEYNAHDTDRIPINIYVNKRERFEKGVLVMIS
jgi:hypothetical protein